MRVVIELAEVIAHQRASRTTPLDDGPPGTRQFRRQIAGVVADCVVGKRADPTQDSRLGNRRRKWCGFASRTDKVHRTTGERVGLVEVRASLVERVLVDL